MISQENLKIKIDIVEGNKNKKFQLVFPSLKDILRDIDSSEFEESVKIGLRRIASSYPHHALEYFRKNVNKFAAKIRSKLPKEEIGEKAL